jgi:RNA polymerase sigma factor (sigma-70 family)
LLAVTEQDAVALCRTGDPAGLATLVELHQADAVRLAALITRDRQLAEDVAADAFLLAFRRIGSFDPARPFRPWFRRVVATTALKGLAARRGEVSPSRRTAPRSAGRCGRCRTSSAPRSC